MSSRKSSFDGRAVYYRVHLDRCRALLAATGAALQHDFSGAGLLLGVLAFFGSASFLSAYLFIVAGQVNGNARGFLLGKARA